MKSIIKSIIKYIFLFVIGGGVYYAIETIWRGYSHWTMFILGGICFITVGLINNIFTWKTPIEIQAIVGSIIITLLEFITGIIVNIKLDWNVWDYSNLPLNILGQVCLPFTLIWIILSILIIFLDDFLRYKFFSEDKPHYISIFKR